MKKYSNAAERNIHVEALVREWTRSGLLAPEQQERMLVDLQVDLRRTNLFLRALLFGFGFLIIVAALALVFVVGEVRPSSGGSVIFLMASALCFGAAEGLISARRLYRFGIEESAAILAAVFLGIAVFLFGDVPGGGRFDAEWHAFLGLAFTSVALIAVYFRFGYVYAAVLAMLSFSMSVFQLRMGEPSQRLVIAGVLLVVFLRARSREDDRDTIQSAAWLGMYLSMNLMIGSRWFSTFRMNDAFYWATYAAIWILPAVGLVLAVRRRDRGLLVVNLLMALGTLTCNKPYLGLTRQTWDPILFGILLIGVAYFLRRYLAREPNGFTAESILSAHKRHRDLVGTAVSMVPSSQPSVPVEADPFKGGGGRSGGAGASGEF